MLASDLESIALSALRFDWDIVGVGEIRLLEQLQWLVFLSFSSVRTITTVHAQSLEALQYKIQTLPALIQEQLKEVCTGVFFKKDKHSLCWELSL
jgi:Tfp pilus assembly ATPase PilU